MQGGRSELLPDRLNAMEFSLLKRRKPALLFLFGVGVPSLALSVLAFRGIQNELALLEQRQLDEYRALADQISDFNASDFSGPLGSCNLLSREIGGVKPVPARKAPRSTPATYTIAAYPVSGSLGGIEPSPVRSTLGA